MSERVYTPDMGEISGFGRGYEAACRKMVLAALSWFDANPTADPEFHGFKNVYGIIVEDNADAKAMTKAMVDAAGGDCTGAMMQACVGHAMFAHKNGWQKYAEELRDRERQAATP